MEVKAMNDYIETITNDMEAEICFQNHKARLKDILVERETIEQVIEYYAYKLKDVVERQIKEIDNFKFKALTYFDVGDINKNETKTLIKYKLPSFEIIETKEKISADRKYFEGNHDFSEFIELEEVFKWSKLKKHLVTKDNKVYFDGELLENAPIEIKEATRQVKY